MGKYKPGYYVVKNGYKPGIYLTWEDCKAQVNKFPNTCYKKFDTKQHASDYIHSPDINIKEKIEVWTDGYCKNNGKLGAIASVGVFFGDNDQCNLSERLPGL